MSLPDFTFENTLWQQGLKHVAGIDEVGRGAFAGPVVVAAVIFPPNLNPKILTGVNDSKLLIPKQRELFSSLIKQTAISYHISSSPVSFINRYGIVKAALSAMRSAIHSLKNPEHLLIDAFRIPYLKNLSQHQTPIIKGDQKSLSIAAASIIAKVHRDQLLITLAKKYPHYGFDRHKGYGTLQHRRIIKSLGPTPHHRSLFIARYI